ncbi:MAG: methyltransferase domain-containing protein [Chloroflexota bacterium]
MKASKLTIAMEDVAASHALPHDSHPVTTGSSGVRIVVVASADRFRRLAKELPTGEDSVLEIGCSTGATTRLLADSGAQVVAVDVAAHHVERLGSDLAHLPNVTVAEVDGRNTPALAGLLPEPDLIFIDIGGNAQLDNVTFQVRQCLRAFAPRLIVVRSSELAALCSLITEVEPHDAPSLRRRATRDALEQTVAGLLDLSRSVNVKNRIYAARKLRKLETPAACQRINELAADPDHRVRRVARLGHTERPAAEAS